MKTVLTTILTAFILSGCNHQSPDLKMKVADEPLAKTRAIAENDKDQPEISSPATQLIPETSKKTIKTGDISFETKNLYGTRTKITAALKSLGGYIAEENETNDTYRKGLVLILRVPSKHFDLLLDSVSGDADKIDSKNVRVTDVTSQFIDIQTSLNNQKLLETRYRELLNRSHKMSDILQIENKLTEIRTSIDSTQGNLNYLSKQVAYSTLEVSFFSDHSPQYSGTTIGDRLSASLRGGWELMQTLFFGLVNVWPLTFIAIPIYLIVKRWRTRRKLGPVQS